jgi:hypothetical protein
MMQAAAMKSAAAFFQFIHLIAKIPACTAYCGRIGCTADSRRSCM